MYVYVLLGSSLDTFSKDSSLLNLLYTICIHKCVHMCTHTCVYLCIYVSLPICILRRFLCYKFLEDSSLLNLLYTIYIYGIVYHTCKLYAIFTSVYTCICVSLQICRSTVLDCLLEILKSSLFDLLCTSSIAHTHTDIP